MTLIRLVIISIALLAGFSSAAHSPTEIGYRLTEEADKKYLEVHLTSLTLFDLLYDLHPELKLRATLNLGRFTAEYEDYFNQHIRLELNDKECKLKYVDSNLIVHDATIRFLVDDFDEEIEEFSITTSGFEFYQHPSFTVLVTTASMTETCFLSKEENTCSTSILVEKQSGAGLPRWLYLAVIVGCLVPLGWVAGRRFAGI